MRLAPVSLVLILGIPACSLSAAPDEFPASQKTQTAEAVRVGDATATPFEPSASLTPSPTATPYHPTPTAVPLPTRASAASPSDAALLLVAELVTRWFEVGVCVSSPHGRRSRDR